MEDPLLQSKKVADETVQIDSAFNEGLAIVKISKEKIDYVGNKFNDVFNKINCSRNGFTMAHGAIFAIGTKKIGNEEWREQAALSIREMLHKWKRNQNSISDDFYKTFKDINTKFPKFDSSPDIYNRIVAYYSYFSCICHHEASSIIVCLRILDGPQIKAGDDNEESFLQKVEEFFSFFERLFTENSESQK